MFGREELGSYKEPFNADRNCISMANKSVYDIPLKGKKNALTNQNDGNFTITEIEVW